MYVIMNFFWSRTLHVLPHPLYLPLLTFSQIISALLQIFIIMWTNKIRSQDWLGHVIHIEHALKSNLDD